MPIHSHKGLWGWVLSLGLLLQKLHPRVTVTLKSAKSVSFVCCIQAEEIYEMSNKPFNCGFRALVCSER